MSTPDPDSAAGLLRSLAQSLRWQEELGAFGLRLPPAPSAEAVRAFEKTRRARGTASATVSQTVTPTTETRSTATPRPAASTAATSTPAAAAHTPTPAPATPKAPSVPKVASPPDRPTQNDAPARSTRRDAPWGPAHSPSPVAEDGTGAAALERIRHDLGPCERCRLCEGRNHIVFGVGNPNADLMFIGEAPGFHEDRQGEPFVGRAGELLDKMIRAMKLTREEVYIANIIKCRPPDNRDPEDDEILACEPFLLRQIAAVQPKVIVSLGRVSAWTLLRVRTGITRLRGTWREYHGVKLMPTFHPAYLLRRPEHKRESWDDLQAVMAELGLGGPR